ncbi:MAG TPA: ComEC/Rec2 family competence protein [Saprospiraceae bacterium]|nr:ComEC/Rec2 family competence protein [Saprospiraceae bacterium]
MLNWQEVPFVRLLLPYVSGLLIAAQGWVAHWSVPQILALFVLAYIGLLALSYRRLAYQYRWLGGANILTLSFLAALGCWQLQTPGQQPNHYIQQGDRTQYYLFRIEAIKPSSSGKSNRLELAILGFGKQPGSLSQVTGRSFCYLPADFLFSVGQYGLAEGKFQKIAPPRHPGSFDFAQFMARQGMVRQFYLPDKRVYLLKAPPFFSLRTQINYWSARLQHRLSDLLPPRSAGLVAALVLGQKNHLDAEVKANYATVGAMHVLAVSGMHVGIVAMGLQFLFGFWRKPGPLPKFIKASLTVAGIWLFALLAGAAPSVLRAAAMFSLFTLGRELYLQKNVWNILAATALIMLCLDTRSLFAVGFQLSYAAVAAIVYFQPRIYRLYLPRFRALDYTWQLLSLGLAAQLGTAAISIHYFHQFPLYFWLSGLVIVPLATLALLLGLAVLVLGELPILGELLTAALDHLVQFMNHSMGWIADLPSSSMSPLHLSGRSALLVLGLTFGTVLYYHYRNQVLAGVLFAVAGLLLWQQNVLVRHHWQQQEYLIYASRRGLGLTLVEGLAAQTYVSDSSVLAEIAYAKKAYLLHKRTQQHREDVLASGSQVIRWQGQTILWLQQAIDEEEQAAWQPDLVIIGSSFQKNQLAILQDWQPEQVLIQPSLPFREKKTWRKALQEHDLPLANPSDHNAYFQTLK